MAYYTKHARTRSYRCDVCGAIFYASKDSATCSNKCRQKLYRERKAALEAALELQSTLREAIAEAAQNDQNGGAE